MRTVSELLRFLCCSQVIGLPILIGEKFYPSRDVAAVLAVVLLIITVIGETFFKHITHGYLKLSYGIWMPAVLAFTFYPENQRALLIPGLVSLLCFACIPAIIARNLKLYPADKHANGITKQ